MSEVAAEKALARFRPWLYAAALYNLLWGRAHHPLPRRALPPPPSAAAVVPTALASSGHVRAGVRSWVCMGGTAPQPARAPDPGGDARQGLGADGIPVGRDHRPIALALRPGHSDERPPVVASVHRLLTHSGPRARRVEGFLARGLVRPYVAALQTRCALAWRARGVTGQQYTNACSA